jgi:hypothetical protein
MAIHKLITLLFREDQIAAITRHAAKVHWRHVAKRRLLGPNYHVWSVNQIWIDVRGNELDWVGADVRVVKEASDGGFSAPESNDYAIDRRDALGLIALLEGAVPKVDTNALLREPVPQDADLLTLRDGVCGHERNADGRIGLN